MKKAISFITLILTFLTLSLTACNKGDDNSVNQINNYSNSESIISNNETTENISSTQTSAYTSEISGTASSQSTAWNILPDNSTDYNLLLNSTPSEDELFDFIGISCKTDDIIEQSGYNLSLEILNNQFPIECLRQMNDGRYYVIYKTQENGLLYIFFKEFYGTMYYTHCFYWPASIDVTKYQSGDSISLEQARSVDEILARINSSQSINAIITGDTSFYTLHPTETGFIRILYATLNNDSTYNVSVEVTSNFIFQYENQIFDCSILSMDFPH